MIRKSSHLYPQFVYQGLGRLGDVLGSLKEGIAACQSSCLILWWSNAPIPQDLCFNEAVPINLLIYTEPKKFIMMRVCFCLFRYCVTSPLVLVHCFEKRLLLGHGPALVSTAICRFGQKMAAYFNMCTSAFSKSTCMCSFFCGPHIHVHAHLIKGSIIRDLHTSCPDR